MLTAIRRLRYPGSRAYWENRYARGGTSGSGSEGPLAAYKAGWLNRFVQEKQVRTVVELGCGDGRQLRLAEYPDYLGLDIAASAVQRCRDLFANDPSKRFEVYDPASFDAAPHRADLAISIEVIFHLTEDALYQLYLQHLFACARRWVVIFASDEPDTTGGQFPHFRPRRFSPDVPAGWSLRAREPNPLRKISVSDFFIFENICAQS